VLPFKNLNNDPASSFYEFALADAVITELARIRSLVVRPSSVMSKYQGQPVDPADVGRELNVDAVLSAGFIHIGERFRVTAQLLDVRSSEIIWSDKIDASADDVIAVQLSDAALAKMKTEKKKDASFFEELIVAGVRIAVGKSVEYPIAGIRSVDYRDGVLRITNDQNKPVFTELKVNGAEILRDFSSVDAARFVAAFRARKATR